MTPAREMRELVRESYSAAAVHPEGRHPFPTGREFALALGYTEEWLAGVPSGSVEAFAGVSNLAVTAPIPPGATVLDLGCGAGLDALIAARRARRVVALDFSPAMVGRAAAGVRSAGAGNVLVACGDAESLPLPDASVDLALANGIFNLNPARADIFRELARVVRPGGAVFAAELVLVEPLLPPERTRDNWFA